MFSLIRNMGTAFVSALLINAAHAGWYLVGEGENSCVPLRDNQTPEFQVSLLCGKSKCPIKAFERADDQFRVATLPDGEKAMFASNLDACNRAALANSEVTNKINQHSREKPSSSAPPPKPFAVYVQGNRAFFLQQSACSLEKGWKSGFAITNGARFPSCWRFAKDSPNTVGMCFIYEGKVSNDCWFASRSLYVDPATLPQPAFR